MVDGTQYLPCLPLTYAAPPQISWLLRTPPCVMATWSREVSPAPPWDITFPLCPPAPPRLVLVPPPNPSTFQGQYDILDGPASSEAWISSLPWPQQDDFNMQLGELWYVQPLPGPGPDQRHAPQAGSPGTAAAAKHGAGLGLERGDQSGGRLGRGRAGDEPVAAGWRRAVGRLEHRIVYRAGHMVPHDQPRNAQAMLEEWVLSVLGTEA